jgi:CRP-like cAMP-binding protein
VGQPGHLRLTAHLRVAAHRPTVAGARSYLKSSADALQSVRAVPTVRGYVGAIALLDIAQYTSGMVIWLYVFARGGTEAISLLVITSSGTVAVLAAPTSGFADRYGRGRIAGVGALLRAAVLLAMALSIAAKAPVGTTIVLAGVEGAVYSIGAPALRALAPTLVQSPSELGSVNLIISLGLALAVFLGPLVGGLAYQLTGAAPVVAVVAAVFALHYPRLSRFQQQGPPVDTERATQSRHGRLSEALAGLRSAASERDIRLTLLVFCGYSFAVGILDVVLIVIARDVLHQSDSGAGALYSAFGVGGLLAGAGIGQLVRARLARVFGIAVVLWAVPIAGIAFVAQAAIVWVCAFFAGIAGTVAQAAGDTVLQRATPDRLMSRVLGAYEALTGTAYMVAALVPAILIASLGVRAVLVLGAAVAPLVVICCWRGLLQLDRDLGVDDERLTLVSGVPWLHTGSLAEQDRLAALLEEQAASGGEVILYQGETGVRFYILRSGAVRVLVDGREVSHLRSGDWFGEVALLSDIPRTATVQAMEDSVLLSLADDDFHRALAGPGFGARDTSRALTIPAGAAIDDFRGRVDLLTRLPLLSYLPIPAVERIASASSTERRHPGETILVEGARPGDAYIIWDGHIQISQHGRPRRVACAGELIGEIATLHGHPLTEAAVALDDAVLLRLPREELLVELAPPV